MAARKKLQKLFSFFFSYIFSLCFSIADFAVLSHRRKQKPISTLREAKKKPKKRRQRNERKNEFTFNSRMRIVKEFTGAGDASEKPVFGFIIALFAADQTWSSLSLSLSFALSLSHLFQRCETKGKQECSSFWVAFFCVSVCLCLWTSAFELHRLEFLSLSLPCRKPPDRLRFFLPARKPKDFQKVFFAILLSRTRELHVSAQLKPTQF